MSRLVHSAQFDAPLLSIGLGAMGMSFPGVDEQQCFATLQHALEQAGPGEKLVINSSEHYGAPGGNIKLLSRFFSAHPELRERAFVVLKGGLGIFDPGNTTGHLHPDSSPEGLRHSANGIAAAFAPFTIDVFEPGRVDKSVPIEDAMRTLVSLKEQGFFKHIGLSECSAQTLQRAAAVCPIATAEIEISPFAYEPETKAVLSAAAQTGTVVLAYSPIGRGMVPAKSRDDINPVVQNMFPRFSEDNFAHNQQLAAKIQALAAERGLTPAQLSIAWVKGIGRAQQETATAQAARIVPIPGTTRVERVKENMAPLDIDLSAEDMQAITQLAENAGLKGDRYPGIYAAMNWG